jgi:outer membrane protein TolC
LEARFNANKANSEAADAALRRTVLTAIKDVETSISALDAARKTKNDLGKTFSASEEEYAMTKKRIK